MKDYNDIDKKIESLLIKEFKKIKGKGDIGRAFQFFEHEKFDFNMSEILD